MLFYVHNFWCFKILYRTETLLCHNFEGDCTPLRCWTYSVDCCCFEGVKQRHSTPHSVTLYTWVLQHFTLKYHVYHFHTACSWYTVQNRGSFISCNPKLVSHTESEWTHYNLPVITEEDKGKMTCKWSNSSTPTKGCSYGVYQWARLAGVSMTTDHSVFSHNTSDWIKITFKQPQNEE
jgi:hypothetical protein